VGLETPLLKKIVALPILSVLISHSIASSFGRYGNQYMIAILLVNLDPYQDSKKINRKLFILHCQLIMKIE
jgi:hypothetical protein